MDDLTHLFSAYFYEAWDEYEYGTWEEAVDDFVRRSPKRVAGAAASLGALLDEKLSEDELDGRLRAQGCAFAPDHGDRAWLVQLLDRLRSASEGAQPVSTAN